VTGWHESDTSIQPNHARYTLYLLYKAFRVFVTHFHYDDLRYLYVNGKEGAILQQHNFTYPAGLGSPGVGSSVSGRTARVFLLAMSRLQTPKEAWEAGLLLVRLLASTLLWNNYSAIICWFFRYLRKLRYNTSHLLRTEK